MKSYLLRLITLFLLLFCVWGKTAYAENYHFKLKGPQDKIITETDFADKYLLVVFGFTSCPDVCPTTLLELKEVLSKMKHPEDIQTLFITIDPLRDDSKRLNQYVGFFDSRIIGLSGSLADIDPVTKQFNASYGYQYEGKSVSPPNLPTGYIPFHSTQLYLLSPGKKRELVDVYDYQAGAKNLQHGIEQAIKQHRKKP